MQPLILRGELVKAGADVLGDLRRGVGRLLRERGEDAVLAVELGIDLVGVVRGEHRRDVREPDRLDAVDAEVEEYEVGQLLRAGELLADGDHIAHAVIVIDVTGGHGEVLRRQNAGDGRDGEHPAEVGLPRGLLARGGERGQALGDLALGRGKLAVGEVYLPQLVHHGEQRLAQRLALPGDIGRILQLFQQLL